MEATEIINVVSTVGFPIFSFLLCGKALKYVYDKERKSLDDAVGKLGELTEAVNHNSEVVSQLVRQAERREDDD